MCLLDVLAIAAGRGPAGGSACSLGDGGPLRAEAEALGVPCRVLPLPPALARLGDAGLKAAARCPGGGSALAPAPRRGAAAALAAAYLGRLRQALREGGPDRGPHQRHEGARPGRLGRAPRRARSSGTCTTTSAPAPSWPGCCAGRPAAGHPGLGVSHSVAEDAARTLGPEDPGPDRLQRRRPRPVRPRAPAVDPRRRLGPAAAAPGARSGSAWSATFATLEGPRRLPRRRRRGSTGRSAVPVLHRGRADLPHRRLAVDHRGAARPRRGLGLGERVGFAGYQPDPAAAIRGLDVVVHASTRPEPFGRVIVEGMACGKAVIAVNRAAARPSCSRTGRPRWASRPTTPRARPGDRPPGRRPRLRGARLGAAGRASAAVAVRPRRPGRPVGRRSTGTPGADPARRAARRQRHANRPGEGDAPAS